MIGQDAQAGRRFTLRMLFMNLLIYPLLILQTLVFILCSPAVLPVARVVTGRPLDWLVRYFIRMYGQVWMVVMSPFVSFEKHDLTRDRFPRPCIIALNHLSFFDIFCMGALPFSNGAFAIRSWPFRMLWYAPFMRLAGYVDMEALGKDEALQRCRKMLSQGVSLMFFPEGHRSRNGRIGRFYSGAFKLAVETGTPVVPLCISGTDQLLPAETFVMAPAVVRLQALPAVDPASFSGESGHVELRKHVKSVMVEALGKASAQSVNR